tara:strand:- start:330 stop:581 length:252 start_codon:yes stop_codon:yes gene_type:complete
MYVAEIVNSDLYKLYLLSQVFKNRKNQKKARQQFRQGNITTTRQKKAQPVKKRRYNQDINAPEPYDTREPFVSNREPYDSREL